jgi:hypothetical protein
MVEVEPEDAVVDVVFIVAATALTSPTRSWGPPRFPLPSPFSILRSLLRVPNLWNSSNAFWWMMYLSIRIGALDAGTADFVSSLEDRTGCWR